MTGSAVKNHGWPKMGKKLLAKLIISYLLSYQGRSSAFRKQFVFNIENARYDAFRVTRSRQNSKWLTSFGKPRWDRFRRDGKRWSIARCSWVVAELHRTSGGSRNSCGRTFFSKRLRFGTSYESIGTIKIEEAWYLYSLPKRLELRRMFEDQNYEVSWQKTHWRSIYSSSRKVWWLDNGGSQCPQWGRWISEQSQICCRGTRSCHSMDSVIPVQNQNFSGNRKDLTKVSRTVTKSEKSFTLKNSIEFGKSCETISVESPNFNTSSIWDEWYCWESSAESKRRNFSCTVTIWA